jgi:hypothetical protein
MRFRNRRQWRAAAWFPGRGTWRAGVYSIIAAIPGRKASSRSSGRASWRGEPGGYYRDCKASAPRQEETAVRDAIQRAALENRGGPEGQSAATEPAAANASAATSLVSVYGWRWRRVC